LGNLDYGICIEFVEYYERTERGCYGLYRVEEYSKRTVEESKVKIFKGQSKTKRSEAIIIKKKESLHAFNKV